MAKKRMTKRQRMRIRQRNRRLALGGIVLLLFLIMLFSGIRACGKGGEEKGKQNNTNVETTVTPTPTPTPTPEPVPTVDLDSMESASGILIRVEDGMVVKEKSADSVIYPASMTKIMTALIGIENLTDLDQLITIDAETYNNLYAQGASLAGFQPGDQVKALDILYGVMLPSGAECCEELATSLFGTEEAFVAKMNEKAVEIGMKQTHFANTTGLHDDQHYTTVRDMSALLLYALQNDTFRTIFCTETYTTAPTASSADGLNFQSTMFKKLETSTVTGGQILGGKTGYTSAAGQCLASLASVNGKEYILVTAAAPAPNGSYSHPYYTQDALYVYNQIGSQTGTPAEVTPTTEVPSEEGTEGTTEDTSSEKGTEDVTEDTSSEEETGDE